MKPVILITGGAAFDREFRSPALVLNKAYSTAVAAVGGIPMLPATHELAQEYCDMSDGLILTGLTTYTPDPSLEGVLDSDGFERRIRHEEALYEAFKKAGKPILGICLGEQMINCYEGGTLKESFKFQDGVEHMKTDHMVSVKTGTILAQLFGESFRVNSRHNTRIDKLGENLEVIAESPDGVIEAVRHKSRPVLGLQWHPERMRGDIPEPPDGPDMTSLFEWFVKECGC